MGTTNPKKSERETIAQQSKENHSAARGLEHLLGTRGKTNAGHTGLRVDRDEGSVVAGSTGELATIAGSLFDVADDSAFGHLAQGENIADLELGLLAAVDELSAVHTFSSNEVFLHLLEPAVLNCHACEIRGYGRLQQTKQLHTSMLPQQHGNPGVPT